MHFLILTIQAIIIGTQTENFLIVNHAVWYVIV